MDVFKTIMDFFFFMYRNIVFTLSVVIRLLQLSIELIQHWLLDLFKDLSKVAVSR